jgi:hypothetical protein
VEIRIIIEVDGSLLDIQFLFALYISIYFAFCGWHDQHDPALLLVLFSVLVIVFSSKCARIVYLCSFDYIL